MLYVMNMVSALDLRQSMGKVVRKLEAGGEPVILSRGNKPVAVLISLKDYQERFAAKAAQMQVRAVAQEIRSLARPAKEQVSTDDLLRELRDS